MNPEQEYKYFDWGEHLARLDAEWEEEQRRNPPKPPTIWEDVKYLLGEVVCFLFIVLIFVAWIGFRSGFGFVAW